MIRLRVDASMTSPFDPELSVRRSGELVKAASDGVARLPRTPASAVWAGGTTYGSVLPLNWLWYSRW